MNSKGDDSGADTIPLEVMGPLFHEHPRLATLLQASVPRKLSWSDVHAIILCEWGLTLYGLVLPLVLLWAVMLLGVMLLIAVGVVPAQDSRDIPLAIMFFFSLGIAPLLGLLIILYRQLRLFRIGTLRSATIHEITLNSISDGQIWSLMLRLVINGEEQLKRYRYDDESGTIGLIDKETALAIYATQSPIIVLAAKKQVKWLAWPERVSQYLK